ncbi:MAG: type II toxin-antitoxin system PemK/MazF family toxin [Nitrospirae bacterium]|nr:type II toxin-antitoxin system PemK/MazF family toxin [Nitrospirota bacterium]
MLRQRDIVLIPIPFTDLTSQKKRPAVIISSDNYNDSNEDIVVVALTSNVEPREFSVALTNDELEEGTLKVTSMIRVDKIYTLNKSIVIKTFGRVKPDILTKIKDSLATLIEVHAAP